MNKVLVIGYGNTLRGDDAAGVHAAELITELHPEISSLIVHQLTPELAEDISEFDTVFFIDAQVNIDQPQLVPIKPRITSEQPRTHFASPESLLVLCHQLYKRMPAKAFKLGIPAVRLDFSEELSFETNQALPQAVRLVEQNL